MDPIWDRVQKLCSDWMPEANVMPVYELVKDAWRMGFDVVKQSADSNLYGDAMGKIAAAQQNAYNAPLAGSNLAGPRFPNPSDIMGPGPYDPSQIMNTKPHGG